MTPTHAEQLEREADHVARQVSGAPGPVSSVRSARLSARPAGGDDRHAPASVRGVLAQPGQPLDPSVRSDLEGRFGWDFSAVRVHAGSAAERSAADVRARAYTVGEHIVFGPGSYAPGTEHGRHLLAHELAHVVQQRNGPAGRGAPSPLQAFGLDDVVEAVTPSAGTRQFVRDAVASVRESPQHVADFFTDEVLETIRQHWLRIVLVSGGILAAEYVVGVLTAAPEPTMITKVVAAVLQIVILAVLGYFAAVEVEAAYGEGVRWLATARRANGDPAVVTQAARSFVRLVWHVVMAVLAVAGVRARIRGIRAPAAGAPPPPAAGGGTPAGRGGATGGPPAPVIPISSHPRFRPRTSPSSGQAPSASAYGPGGTARQLAPAPQPVPQPVAAPPPAPAPAPVSAPAATAGTSSPGSGVHAGSAVAAGLSSATTPTTGPRPPFILRLPREKAPHLRTFRQWIGTDPNRHLRSDPGYSRGPTAQLDRWHRAHRIGGSDGIPDAVYRRGHRMGLTGEEGERRIRVPDWSPTGRTVLMQVDHIIELQVTPPAFRQYFDSMANYELLDSAANQAAGPRLQAAIAAERAVQVAWNPALAGMVLTFDRVEMGGGSLGERWLSDDVRSGRQLDVLHRSGRP